MRQHLRTILACTVTALAVGGGVASAAATGIINLRRGEYAAFTGPHVVCTWTAGAKVGMAADVVICSSGDTPPYYGVVMNRRLTEVIHLDAGDNLRVVFKRTQP